MNFPTIKNLDKLIKISSIETTKKYLDKIEDIKYLMCMISFSYNKCESIDYINDILNNMFRDKPANLVEFIEITNKTQSELRNILKQSINENKTSWETILPDQSEDDIITNVTDIRTVSMSDQVLTKYYNEIENPVIVNSLLNFILKNSAQRKNNTKYEITLYDFNNYSVFFETEDNLNDFVENFVECGTAGVITYNGPNDRMGSWEELYSI